MSESDAEPHFIDYYKEATKLFYFNSVLYNHVVEFGKLKSLKNY